MRDYGKVVFLIVAALLTPLSLQAQWKTRWEYEGAKGPNHWTELDPAYASCNAGMAQSPIDIEASEKAALPALRFGWRSGPLKYIVNNVYTIRVNYHDTAGTGNLLIVGGQNVPADAIPLSPSQRRAHTQKSLRYGRSSDVPVQRWKCRWRGSSFESGQSE